MMNKIYILLIFVLCIYHSSFAQKVVVNYYDKTMHVTDIPDYYIYYQSEEHTVNIVDSTIVTFFLKHISNLSFCDTLSQTTNSLIRIIYEYDNGNFDVVTFNPWSYQKEGMCKNGRMFYYDEVMEKVVMAIINNPDKDDKTGYVWKKFVKDIREYIKKIDMSQ